jgi:hypothetical protein
MTPVGVVPNVRRRGVFRDEMWVRAVGAGLGQHLAGGLRSPFVITESLPKTIELTHLNQ